MNKNNKKNENLVIKFFKTNKSFFIGGIVGLVVGLFIMSLFIPERIAKLENGEEVILSVKNHTFTANDLYEVMKKKSGNEELFKMVDLAILLDRYPNQEEDVSKYVDEQKDAIYLSYEQYYGYSKEDFLEMNGFASETDFLEELKSKYYYQKYYDDYVRDGITEKELNKFYKESVFGEKSIYLFSGTDDDKATLDAVNKALKNNMSFDEIKDKYQTVAAYDYSSVKFFDLDTFTQNTLNKIASTKKGSTSGVFADENLGNVVVYVRDEKEKPAREDIEDELKNTLLIYKQKNDSKLYYQAFIHLRESNDLNIMDTELKKFYEESIKAYK